MAGSCLFVATASDGGWVLVPSQVSIWGEDLGTDREELVPPASVRFGDYQEYLQRVVVVALLLAFKSPASSSSVQPASEPHRAGDLGSEVP